jgi:hypothetical protein
MAFRKIMGKVAQAMKESDAGKTMTKAGEGAPATPSAPSGGGMLKRAMRRIAPAMASAANQAMAAPKQQAPAPGGGLRSRFKKAFATAAQPMADAGENMGRGFKGLRSRLKKMRPAQPAAAPAGMKKGGAVAKKGSAMKSMMADKKGRAMKKTGSDAMGRAMAKKPAAKKPAAKKMMGGGMMGYKFGGMAKKKSGRSC